MYKQGDPCVSKYESIVSLIGSSCEVMTVYKNVKDVFI